MAAVHAENDMSNEVADKQVNNDADKTWGNHKEWHTTNIMHNKQTSLRWITVI